MSKAHAYLSRNAARDILLPDEAGTTHSFLNAQAREFLRFDQRLRNRDYDFPALTMPGGYSQFQALWNADGDCIYQFTELNMTTGDPVIHGLPLPPAVFAPADKGQDASAPAAKGGPSGQSKEVFEFLLVQQAKRAMRQEEWNYKKKVERLAKKAGKGDEDALFGMGPPPAKRARTAEEDVEADADGEFEDDTETTETAGASTATTVAPVASGSEAGGRVGAMEL
ncbi:hypothetical protein B0H21DRAFT_712665 [Amylocystis lapponica]|nr:hypothetical protein B0H21DRAFT_712663 [Amylocystis lapponica]KAH9922441.1 hypothetical protein B0H21DRAFT_712665 [Amylocystis lapponica]